MNYEDIILYFLDWFEYSSDKKQNNLDEEFLADDVPKDAKIYYPLGRFYSGDGPRELKVVSDSYVSRGNYILAETVNYIIHITLVLSLYISLTHYLLIIQRIKDF